MSKKTFSLKRSLACESDEAVIYGRPGDPVTCECITCGRPYVTKIPWHGAILVREEDCDDCSAALNEAFQSTKSLKLAIGDGEIH